MAGLILLFAFQGEALATVVGVLIEAALMLPVGRLVNSSHDGY